MERGISPELLVSQVRNTAPYVFDADPVDAPEVRASAPAKFVRAYQAGAELSHFEYFRLCLCAHYLTCATPVPTDVDNQIRRKLWAPGMPLVVALEMATLVLESRSWDFPALSSRVSYGAQGTEWERVSIHGHLGEWFTVSSAAYAALGLYRANDAKRMRESLLQAISEESERHSNVFGSLWRAKDGLGALRASASIAHNFGDLDRVVDAWDVPIADPLRLRFAGLGTSPFEPDGKLRYQGRLWTAGELYKSVVDGSSMALENHRHFALRKPRALRTRPSLRIPLGPFLDEWGTTVATTLAGDDLGETIDALVHGCQRLPGTFGYARALHAMGAVDPELVRGPAETFRKDARLRGALTETREAFEARWAAEALRQLDEIPSRA